MIGRMTLREIREALEAARRGETRGPTALTVEELEALARTLEAQASATAAAPPAAGAPTEAPPAGRAEPGAAADRGAV
jgi:hypothetical protein